MHPENRLWWLYCRIKYPKYFSNAKVIEFGSYDINGTVRDYFDRCDYTGVDWRPSPTVDIISLAHELNIDEKFDTVISASMLEHDPYLDLSVKKMIDVMSDDGILLLSFVCCALPNTEHCLCEAPDGKYHPVKGGYIRDLLIKHGIYIEEFRYTHKWMNYATIEQISCYIGEILVIGFKNKKNAKGIQYMDQMLSADE